MKIEYLNRSIKDRYPIIYIDVTFIKTRRQTVSSEAYGVVLGANPIQPEKYGVFTTHPPNHPPLGKRSLKTYKIEV